jgi:virginiamycin B lyase
VTLRRIVFSLLTVAVVGAGGAFVRQQWRDFHACEREFEKDSTSYEICQEYGVQAGCGPLDNSPFYCSDETIGGQKKLIAARDTGIFRTRLECATHHQVSVGTRCSPAQWDAWCAARHGGPRQLARCQAAGPDGPEGAPPATATATISDPVSPLSGPPTDCGTLTTYQLPDPKVLSTANPMGSRPGAVAVDPDGSVWFTEFLSGSISHMTVDGKITRRALPTQPSALVRDPGGNLWFTDNATNAIWRLSPDGEARRLSIPETGAPNSPGPPGPADLTVAADGSVWFIEPRGGRVARVNPDLTITAAPLTQGRDGYLHPSSMSAGPDGSVWVALSLGGRIARVDGRTLQVTQFGVHGGGGVVRGASVAVGSDGGVWFEKPNASLMQAPTDAALGRLDPSGGITYHPLPGAARWPGSLTAGPDGAIWFLDGPARTVGRMAAVGTLTEFPFADQSMSGGTLPRQLAAGSDRLWFAQPHTNSLGLITCRRK